MRQRLLVRTCGCLTAVLAMSACASPSSPSTPLGLTRFRPEPTSFLAISGYDQPLTLAIHDRDTWVRSWNDIHSRLSPAPALPEIDFTKEMVLVAAVGSRPSSGYEVVFTGATEASDVVTVDVESRIPGPTCIGLPVVTAPVDLARIPRRNGAIVFRSTPKVVNCPA
jgi:hypothetical protein